MDCRAVTHALIGPRAILKALSYPVAMGATPDNLEPFDIHCGVCGGAISVQLRPSDADLSSKSAFAEMCAFASPGGAGQDSRPHVTPTLAALVLDGC